jgi:hypothetical protein
MQWQVDVCISSYIVYTTEFAHENPAPAELFQSNAVAAFVCRLDRLHHKQGHTSLQVLNFAQRGLQSTQHNTTMDATFTLNDQVPSQSCTNSTASSPAVDAYWACFYCHRHPNEIRFQPDSTARMRTLFAMLNMRVSVTSGACCPEL